MTKQRTLVIVKPDGVQRGLLGPILSRLEARGLKIVGLKLVAVNVYGFFSSSFFESSFFDPARNRASLSSMDAK